MTLTDAVVRVVWSIVSSSVAGFVVGYFIGPRIARWKAERRTHRELLRRERERRERELLEAHIAQHQKLWEDQKR